MADDIHESLGIERGHAETGPNSFAEEAARMKAAGPVPPLAGESGASRSGRLRLRRARALAQDDWADTPAPAFETEEHPGRPPRAWPWILLIVAIVAAVVGAYVVISDRSASAGPQFGAVPEVVGMPETKAVDEIESAGFDCRIAGRQPSTEVEEGLVISQGVAGGTKFQKGKTVGL
jgi:hypothetical protein